MAFIGDAVAHAVFLGLSVAFVRRGSLVLGGAADGGVLAVLVARVLRRAVRARDRRDLHRTWVCRIASR
ncbi:metal ABC transporter permease [Oerskovia merdavium]|uniref:metal ABC transporter permease n=1 Tax=Oerskovia merdavium TaxID=2762227 RepID=UPI0038516CF5